MTFRSWLPLGGLTRNGRRRAPAVRRTQLTLELLEDRLTPSGDGLPAISGPGLAQEGALYTLQLDAQGKTLQQWTIDWGDGTTDTVAGSTTSASHVYDDGPAGHTITATAVQTVPLTLFQWDPNAGGNGHYYGLTNTAETWLAAEAEAVGLGGHLASITNAAEQAFIVNTFLSGANSRNILWLGLTDQAVEGTFVWSSGEPVTYTNWQAGEPNNFKGIENYVAINWHYGHFIGGGVLGAWNDTPLDGFNFNATQPEPERGIMEFTAPPVTNTVRTLQVNVENVPPTASVAGPDLAVRGQLLTFTLGAADPSKADQAAGFTFSIDWDGDGTVDQVVSGPSGTTVQHAFASTGTFNVGVTATDRDGGVSTPATQLVDVRAAALEPDPLDPSLLQLVVGGTSGDDLIILARNDKQGGVRVWINGHDEGVFTPTGGIVAHGYEGNDVLLVCGHTGPVQLYGDAGNDLLVDGPDGGMLFGGTGDDVLIGGCGSDVLVGGDGNDVLIGGGGRDVLIGGLGRDVLIGGGGEDLLITGATTFDQDPVALAAIQAEWTSDRSRAVRLQNLHDGTGSADRLNDAYFLNADTLLADQASDRVLGAQPSRDALFVSDEDWLSGRHSH
jgi:Ca2+-binding RTX toxin-like protein